jgi:hypothetical protein
MKNRIELTVEHKDHSTVELTNGKGDTFTYNPQKYKGLEDFLNGAKILLIADVSKSFYCYEELDEKLPRCEKQCVVCRSKQKHLQQYVL